jgi:ABC-2 type transport system permease protein
MKLSIRIARIELGNLFFSPIAWIVLVALFYQCGLGLINSVDDVITRTVLEPDYLKNNPMLQTEYYFGPDNGFVPGIVNLLYLYLPLITMGLISREQSSGTITLLYSSPVRVRDIVFGKFLAMLCFNLILLLALALTAGIAMAAIPHADFRLLLSMLLGVYLLLCTYSAIGLFISCLTRYQVAAAFGTLVVLAILSYIGHIWQGINFVRDLTYFLSLPGRAEHLMAGLISTEDLVYFAVITGIFLAWSVCKLQFGRENRPAGVRATRYTIILLTGLVIGYVASRPALTAYYDATSTKRNTLSAETQKILKDLGDDPVELTVYNNFLDRMYYRVNPEARNDNIRRWAPYVRFKPNLHFQYVYYYDTTYGQQLLESFHRQTIDQIAARFALGREVDLEDLLSHAQLAKKINLRPELYRCVIDVRYKNKQTFLRTFDDGGFFPEEAEIAAAFQRFTLPTPRIVALQQEQEHDLAMMDQDSYAQILTYKPQRGALVNQGFDVDTLATDDSLRKSPSILLIGGPKTSFSAKALAAIDRYIAAGGNLLIAGEPGKQDIVNPILRPLGVRLMNGTVVQQGRRFFPNFLLTRITPQLAGFKWYLRIDYNWHHPVVMPGAAGLQYDSSSPFHITPLLVTDSNTSWNKTGVLVPDSATVQFDPAHGDHKAEIPTAIALTRTVHGREQRIVVTGDADFMANGRLLSPDVEDANIDFTVGALSWLAYNQSPKDLIRPTSTETQLFLNRKNLPLLKLILLGIAPGFFLVFGSVLLIIRKRK